jgi:hypothetical protein
VGTKRKITIYLGELCSVTDTACFFRVLCLYLHGAHIASPVESYRENEGNPARGLVLEPLTLANSLPVECRHQQSSIVCFKFKQICCAMTIQVDRVTCLSLSGVGHGKFACLICTKPTTLYTNPPQNYIYLTQSLHLPYEQLQKCHLCQ